MISETLIAKANMQGSKLQVIEWDSDLQKCPSVAKNLIDKMTSSTAKLNRLALADTFRSHETRERYTKAV